MAKHKKNKKVNDVKATVEPKGIKKFVGKVVGGIKKIPVKKVCKVGGVIAGIGALALVVNNVTNREDEDPDFEETYDDESDSVD